MYGKWGKFFLELSLHGQAIRSSSGLAGDFHRLWSFQSSGRALVATCLLLTVGHLPPEQSSC